VSDAATSRWDDYLEIFTSPSRVYARRTDGKYGHPMLVYTIAVAVLYFATSSAMEPILNAEMARGMARNPDMTPEQMEGAVRFGKMISAVFVVLSGPLMALLVGAFATLAAKLIGKTITIGQGVTIAVLAFFPRLIEAVVAAVQALLMDESALKSRYSVSLGIGRFLDPETTSGSLLGVLGRIDLFTLWVTVLIGIGIKVVARTTPGEAVTAAVIVYVLGAIPVALFGMLGG
jgi:hypothetical protein